MSQKDRLEVVSRAVLSRASGQKGKRRACEGSAVATRAQRMWGRVMAMVNLCQIGASYGRFRRDYEY